MKTFTYLLSLVLVTTLVACGGGEGQGVEREPASDGNGTAALGTEQNPHSGGTETGNAGPPAGVLSAGATNYATVSMSCLRSMDREGWRNLGLNDDQMARVKRLQQSMQAEQNTLGASPGTNGSNGSATGNTGGSTGSATPTHGAGTANSLGTGGMQTDRGTHTGGNSGTAAVPPQDGNTPSDPASDGLDQRSQNSLSEILSGEQLASLGRLCNRETGTQGTP